MKRPPKPPPPPLPVVLVPVDDADDERLAAVLEWLARQGRSNG
jgi:hypothetical protein